MIHYDLKCGEDHAFDGWFRDSAAFERQARDGLLACPVCSTTKVARALMAPALARPGRQPDKAASRQPEKAASGSAGEGADPAPPAPSVPREGAARTVATGDDAKVPDQVRAMLQRLRAEVERHCDYVGGGFAEEARRIHRGEANSRGIYGETTPEQAETLAEEGIQVARIPWVPRADG